MPAPRTGATRVRYQRSNERRRAAELIQIWKSDATGREFEIRESRSFAASDELVPGTEGFLDFTSGTPAVTRRPLERSERLGRYQQRRKATDSGTSPPHSRNLGGWLLAGALLLIVLWNLL